MTIEAKPLSNSQVTAAKDVIKAAESERRASERFTARVAKLRESGVTADDIKDGGRLLADFQRLTAETILNEKELTMWANEELAQTKTVNGKRVNMPRGAVIKRVNSVIRRIREKLAAAPAGDGKAKGKSSNGAGKAKRSSTQVFFDTLDGYVKAFADEKASDKFEFDTKIARAAFVKLLKELK